jgi:hypothetical protein
MTGSAFRTRAYLAPKPSAALSSRPWRASLRRSGDRVDYVIIWFEAGQPREMLKENAEEAFATAKAMIDQGRPGVEIRMPATRSVIKSRAILDIFDAIESGAPAAGNKPSKK